MADDVQQLERVRMIYNSSGPNGDEEVELPFRILVLGDFTSNEASEYLDQQMPENITEGNFNSVMRKLSPELNLQVDNKLSESSDQPFVCEFAFHSLNDFSPEYFIKQSPELRILCELRQQLIDIRADNSEVSLDRFFGGEVGGSVASEFLLSMGINEGETIDEVLLDSSTTELDECLSRQVDAILHHPKFQALESAWRSLHFLVSRVNFEENILVEILNISKQGLAENFEDVPETIQSELYKIIYSEEFGQFGGRPYSCMVANYIFSPSAPDIWLLQQIASVAAMSHSPFLAAAGPEFFDIDSFSGLARLRDLSANFEQPRFAKWNSFRESEDARYVSLSLPGFKLRSDYGSDGNRIGVFDYQERTSKKTKGLWGNAAFAFCSRLVDSFAKTRWCVNVVGKEYGKVEGLHMSEGGGTATSDRKIPTEILISDKRETELVRWGFVPLTVHKGDDSAAFYSANSVQAIKEFPDTPAGKQSAMNHHLGSQLSYLFIISRLSHYIKMMQREHIGSWKNRHDIERELSDWIRQYVADMDNPTAGVRARRPLRHAKIAVEEIEGKAGWYLIAMAVTPHLKYMGSYFTLKETGKLDKN